MNIQVAKPSDHHKIITLMKLIQEFHIKNEPHIYKSLAEETLNESVNFHTSSKDSLVLVCEKNSEIIGYIIAERKVAIETPFTCSRNYILINQLAVDESYRRLGVASALCEAIIKWAENLGISQIELNVRSFNLEAISFYEKLGFKNRSSIMALKLGNQT